MSCKYEKYIEQYLDGDLSSRREKEFDAHLKDCKSCKNRISESINFNNVFISAVSGFPFESSKSSIISEAKNMKKNFGVHSIMHSLYKFVLPAAAAIAACLLIYNFKPVYKYVYENIYNKYLQEQVTAPVNSKIEISDENLNNIISNYFVKNKETAADTINAAQRTFEIHKIYGTVQKKSKLFVYIYYFAQSYEMKYDGNPVITSTSPYSPIPAEIVIENKNNSYVVSGCEEPLKDEDAKTFIKRMFPPKISNSVLNNSRDISDMKNSIQDKVKSWSEYHDMNLTKINIQPPKGMKFVMNTKTSVSNTAGTIFKGSAEQGYIGISYNRIYYKKKPMHDLPNHSTIISSENIETPLGNGMLYILECDNPAASNDKTIWNEMHAFIYTKDDQYEFNVWLKTKDAGNQSKKDFIELLNNITFK